MNYIVFSGGGVRGFGFVGAYEMLKNKYSFIGFGGASIGSFFALMALLECTFEEMYKYLSEVINIKSLLNNVNIENVRKNWGFTSQQHIAETVSAMLKSRDMNENCTLQDLYKKTNRAFHVSVVRVNDFSPHILDWTKYPNMPVHQAICASMCIPILFNPIRVGNDIFIDGGILNNLPLGSFPSENTLGLILTTQNPYEVVDVKDYIQRIFYGPLTVIEKTSSQPLPHHLIQIDTYQFASLQINTSEVDKKTLIALGAFSILSQAGGLTPIFLQIMSKIIAIITNKATMT